MADNGIGTDHDQVDTLGHLIRAKLVTPFPVRSPVSQQQATNFADVLQITAASRPDDVAFIVLEDGENESQRVTWASFERQAHTIAFALQQSASPGDRALLVYSSGLDCVIAIAGCLLAGVIPVPVAPPTATQSRRGNIPAARIAIHCQPTVILTGGADAPRLRQRMETVPLPECQWINTTELSPSQKRFTVSPARPDDVALLQYTSGSTSDPRGVMVTHGNLLAHGQMLTNEFSPFLTTDSPPLLSWLPHYHDMGLMGFLLQAISMGMTCVILPPAAVIHSPQRWLRALAHYRARMTAAPNFLLDHTVTRLKADPVGQLDLSHLKSICAGAEPIHTRSLLAIESALAPYGLSSTCLRPCYGLAEATLQVTGQTPGERWVPVTTNAPGQSSQRPAVGCGKTSGDVRIALLDPETNTLSRTGQGEICVSGPTVASGYWNEPDATRETFEFKLADQDVKWLRTGDLGFIAGDQLVVTGRCKDLIIIRGRNLAPHDIEEVVRSCHPAFEGQIGAAIGITGDSEERLVILQEVSPQWIRCSEEQKAAMESAISKAITQQFEVRPCRIFIQPTGSLPRTTSGKIQRSAARRMLP